MILMLGGEASQCLCAAVETHALLRYLSSLFRKKACKITTFFWNTQIFPQKNAKKDD